MDLVDQPLDAEFTLPKIDGRSGVICLGVAVAKGNAQLEAHRIVRKISRKDLPEYVAVVADEERILTGGIGRCGSRGRQTVGVARKTGIAQVAERAKGREHQIAGTGQQDFLVL